MNITLPAIVLLFFSLSLSAQVEMIGFEDLRPELEKEDDTVRVINFWATWCAPCVKEMPYFVKAHEKYRDQKVKFLLVNLDMPSNLEELVLPFMERFNIQAKVVLLDDPDANRWIPVVDQRWTGAIPATVIYKRNLRTFVEGTLTFEELDGYISDKL